MKNFVLITLLAFVFHMFPGHACADCQGQKISANVARSTESDNGFTEDTIRPFAKFPETGIPVPSEPPAFKGMSRKNIVSSLSDIYDIRMYYPSFGNPKLDKAIREWATDYCYDFSQTAIADHDENEAFFKWEMAGTYSVTQSSQNVVSVLFRIYVYSGGAHGSINHIAKTFDIRTGKEIPKSQFFTDQKAALTILSEYCRADLAKREDSEGLDSIEEGTEATPQNFDIIVPRPNGLVAIFYSGQLGSMASGYRLVFVPLEKFRGYTDPGIIWQ